MLRYPDGSFRQVPRPLAGRPDSALRRRASGGGLASSRFPEFRANFTGSSKNRRDIVGDVLPHVESDGEQTLRPDDRRSRISSRRMLERVWDPAEFLSDYGIRSLSKYHERHPFVFGEQQVRYEPARVATTRSRAATPTGAARSGFRRRFLIIESLRKLGQATARSFKVAPPGDVGRIMGYRKMAADRQPHDPHLHARRAGTAAGLRRNKKFQEDPHWRDLILFYEFYHGDNGAGLGASHQTGWTGLVAALIDEWRR